MVSEVGPVRTRTGTREAVLGRVHAVHRRQLSRCRPRRRQRRSRRIASSRALLAVLGGRRRDRTAAAIERRAAGRGRRRRFFGVVPQGALTDEDLERMGQGNVGTLRLIVPWACDRPNAGARRLRLRRRSTRSCSARPRPGTSSAADRSSGPRSGSPRTSTVSDCEPELRGVRARARRRRSTRWREFVGELVDRYGPDGDALGGAPELEPSADPRLADLERAELADLLPARSPTSPPTPTLVERGRARSVEARPRRRGDPRRHVRHTVQGRAARRSSPPSSCASCTRSTASREDFDGVAVHPYAAQPGEDRGAGRAAARRDRRAPTTTPRLVGHRDRLRRPSEAQRTRSNAGPEGQAEQLREAVRVLHRPARRVGHRGRHLVRVA